MTLESDLRDLRFDWLTHAIVYPPRSDMSTSNYARWWLSIGDPRMIITRPRRRVWR